MSKNTNIAELINYISVDGSGNVVLSTGQLVATQNYVGTAISNLVASAPSTLDTLNELATALGNDANFATTVATSIGTKQAQLNGTGFVKISGTTISYDNSTYLTTGTASSTYVPYTGATADVVLGTNNLKSKNTFVEGDGSYNGGGLRIKQYVSQADGIDNYNTISSQSSGFAFSSSFGGGIFKNFILDASSLTNTTQRVYTLPDASGTLALTSNLSSYLPLAGGTLSGDIQMGSNQNRIIKFRTATAWDYSLRGVNDDFFITDNPGLNYLALYYNTGGNNRYASLMNVLNVYANGSSTFSGALSGTSASFSGNVTLTSGYIEMPWASDTRTIWERYFSSTYFQRISSNGTLRQLRLESNGAYGNASIVLDGQSNTTVTATITSDKFVATGAATFNGNVTTSGVSTLQSAVRINNGTGGTSPILTFGTENESVQGFKGIYLESYWMYMQVHYNEGLRIRATNGTGTTQTIATFSGASGNFSTLGNITAGGTITAGGNISARNFNKYVRSWSSNGSYVWSEQFDAIAGSFDNAGWYKGFIREANGAHYRGFYFDILVGQKGYGGLSSQYRVFNIVSADSPYVGGCGGSAFASIDNNGFTKQANPCGDDLLLYITKLGG